MIVQKKIQKRRIFHYKTHMTIIHYYRLIHVYGGFSFVLSIIKKLIFFRCSALALLFSLILDAFSFFFWVCCCYYYFIWFCFSFILYSFLILSRSWFAVLLSVSCILNVLYVRHTCASQALSGLLYTWWYAHTTTQCMVWQGVHEISRGPTESHAFNMWVFDFLFPIFFLKKLFFKS